jgi:hypothetical protein
MTFAFGNHPRTLRASIGIQGADHDFVRLIEEIVSRSEPKYVSLRAPKRATRVALVVTLILFGSFPLHAKPALTVVKTVVVKSYDLRCPIQITDPYGGELTSTGYTLTHPPKKMMFGSLDLEFECLSVDDVKNILFAVSGAYDETLGSWRQDMSALLPEEQSETRTFPIRAANSTGFGKTRDSILRDFQNRDFAFCLRHPPVVICGKTPHIAGPDYKRTDLMPYALKIIKSIRFVDDQRDDAEGIPASAAAHADGASR